jgi:hypothetical protein
VVGFLVGWGRDALLYLVDWCSDPKFSYHITGFGGERDLWRLNDSICQKPGPTQRNKSQCPMMRSSGGKPTNDLHRSAIERSMFQKQKPA